MVVLSAAPAATVGFVVCVFCGNFMRRLMCRNARSIKAVIGGTITSSSITHRATVQRLSLIGRVYWGRNRLQKEALEISISYVRVIQTCFLYQAVHCDKS